MTYDSDSGSPATDLLEMKLLLNSVISDSNISARFCSMHLKDIFLHTPMHSPELMKLAVKYFLHDIIENYNLNDSVHNGYIFIKIKRGMYGLKQASVLAYQYLSKLLTDGEYTQILGSLGMWKHETRKTLFCLCVGDFGMTYFSQEDVQHLHDTIATEFTCKIDWKGGKLPWIHNRLES